MDAADVFEFILIAVALKHGQHFPRGFENLPYFGVVLHAVVVVYIEPLMGENQHRLVVARQV